MRSVRFRTLGCYPLTGAVDRPADTLPEIIQEMLLTTSSERQDRMIDHDQAGSIGTKSAGYAQQARIFDIWHTNPISLVRDILAYLETTTKTKNYSAC